MIIGLLADLHGNGAALRAVLAELRRLGVSRLLIAGDFVGYYPGVNEVFDQLRPWPLEAVLGNHDGCLLGMLASTPARRAQYGLDVAERLLDPEYRAWLAGQPFRREITIDGREILLCHGSPADPQEYIYPDRESWSLFEAVPQDIVIMGHTHIPFVRRLEGKLIVNPGSVGQPRDYDPRASFGVLDPERMTCDIHRVGYDIESVRRSVAAFGLPAAFGEILVRQRSTREGQGA